MSVNKWFPLTHQMIVRRNNNYLRSVWIGFTAPIFNLPANVFNLILMPLFTAIKVLVISMVVFPLCGLFGALDAEEITIEEAMQRLIKGALASQKE